MNEKLQSPMEALRKADASRRAFLQRNPGFVKEKKQETTMSKQGPSASMIKMFGEEKAWEMYREAEVKALDDPKD